LDLHFNQNFNWISKKKPKKKAIFQTIFRNNDQPLAKFYHAISYILLVVLELNSDYFPAKFLFQLTVLGLNQNKVLSFKIITFLLLC